MSDEGAIILVVAFISAIIIITICLGIKSAKKAEEEAQQREKARKQKANEERKRQEAIAKRREEERQKLEEERKRCEEEDRKRKEEEEHKRQEEEHKRKEEEERKRQEEERKRNTKCVVCQKCSMGYVLCKNCLNRSKVFQEELPYIKIKDFKATTNFYQELIDKSIFAENKNDREYNSIRLFAVARLLKDRYFMDDIVEQTYDFLSDMEEEGYATSALIIEKYASPEAKAKAEATEEKEEPSVQEQKPMPEDYRDLYKKPYRCEDGDYVRSKSEREIDNFLFRNRIWHIYEPEYICKETGKKYYPDFYLPDYKLYIEYFGLTDEKYLEKKAEKIRMFQNDPDIHFACVSHEDDSNITEKMKAVCQEYQIPVA